MAWFDIFKAKKSSAGTAKDRLQIIVARERHATSGAAVGYLPQLQQELLQVIAKYEHVDLDQVNVSIDRHGDADVLELNIVLPDDVQPESSVRSRRIAYA